MLRLNCISFIYIHLARLAGFDCSPRKVKHQQAIHQSIDYTSYVHYSVIKHRTQSAQTSLVRQRGGACRASQCPAINYPL